MPGAQCTRSLACKIKKHTSVVTTVTPDSPGIPRAMVLTAYFVLSPVTGLVCHRHRRNGLRQLDASVGASGPHDFAVRKPARSSARRRVHRIPRPTSVTIAKRPSVWDGMIRSIPVSTKRESEKFCERGWTAELQDSPSGKSHVAHQGRSPDGTKRNPGTHVTPAGFRCASSGLRSLNHKTDFSPSLRA